MGNGRSEHDSCATDGYASSIYTIAVGSVDQWGQRAFYDEACSARMAVTFNYNNKKSRERTGTQVVRLLEERNNHGVTLLHLLLSLLPPSPLPLFPLPSPSLSPLSFPSSSPSLSPPLLPLPLLLSHLMQITASVEGGCRDDFMGTSASCPMLAGTLALALQAK